MHMNVSLISRYTWVSSKVPFMPYRRMGKAWVTISERLCSVSTNKTTPLFIDFSISVGPDSLSEYILCKHAEQITHTHLSHTCFYGYPNSMCKRNRKQCVICTLTNMKVLILTHKRWEERGSYKTSGSECQRILWELLRCDWNCHHGLAVRDVNMAGTIVSLLGMLT